MFCKEDTKGVPQEVVYRNAVQKDEGNSWNDDVRSPRAQAGLFHAGNDPLQHLAGCQLLLPFPSAAGIL